LVWFASGFYTVDQQERGVVLRLGKLLEELRQPGLQWRPRFVDQVELINVTQVNRISQQSQMLTIEENLVEIDLEVQFHVGDPKSYVVQIREPVESLQHAAESALRHVVGGLELDNIITQGRAVLAINVQRRLQSYIERYQSGIEVDKVIINNAGPPSQVQDSFDDVQRAKEDKSRFTNEGEAYRAKVVQEARGEADKIIAQAEGYRAQVVALAQGEADRFLAILAEYQVAKEVTRDRLYITAMETVLRNVAKVLVDVDGGNNLLLLPLYELMRNSADRQDLLDQLQQLRSQAEQAGLPSVLSGTTSQTSN